MKKAVSVCITVMLTAIILLYAQVQSFVPAQVNGGETREENTYALSEEERKILQAYADYIPQLREEITRSTELMKFDLI